MTRNIEKTADKRTRELLEMLTFMRPSGGKTEQRFIARFIAPLGTVADAAGNHWVTVGTDSPILWSCHTDTVHKREGMQRVVYGDGWASVEQSNCLGADCTTGVWLMVNMVRAGIPGTYVFHANEEIGGLGSEYVAKYTPERLRDIQFAIAFDRKGSNEIITHQGESECASDEFAALLADALYPLRYEASPDGTFTDTANYAGLVPECVNLAVGYHKQHTAKEWQDCEFAIALLDRLLSADFSRLAHFRDETADVYADAMDYGFPWSDETQRDRDDSYEALLDYVRKYPRDVAEFLNMQGYSISEIERELYGYKVTH